MRELTREAFEHDDPNSARHYKDKREKEKRDTVGFIPVPSPLREGGKELSGVEIDADTKGWMFSFGNHSQNYSAALGDNPLPKARKADAKAYHQWVIKEERDRRRFRRTIKRNGKETETWGRHKCGAVSLVVTLPPWAMPVLNSMEDDVRDNLLLRIADVIAHKTQEISERVPWGGGCHMDTDVIHYHMQIPKTAPCGTNLPKAKFKTGGPWLVGADRIDRTFPDLLPNKQKEFLDNRKAKKGKLIDIEIAEAIDRFLERKFELMGYKEQYDKSKKEYAKRKSKSRDTERDRNLIKESFRYFAVEGVWPLAVSTMRLSMWRMIPKEYRILIYASIRAFQIMASPKKALVRESIRLITGRLEKEFHPEPEMLPPWRM